MSVSIQLIFKYYFCRNSAFHTLSVTWWMLVSINDEALIPTLQIMENYFIIL